MVLYPNKLPESERVCSGICMLYLIQQNIFIIEKLSHLLYLFKFTPQKYGNDVPFIGTSFQEFANFTATNKKEYDTTAKIYLAY